MKEIGAIDAEKRDITPERFNAFVNVCVAHRDNYWEYFSEPRGLEHVKENLTDTKIKEHLNGETTLGLSPFLDNENALFIGFDIDIHGLSDGERKEKLIELNGDEDALNGDFTRKRKISRAAKPGARCLYGIYSRNHYYSR